MAGSKTVYELHGNSDRFFCMKCRREYPVSYIEECGEVPYCECGGLIRPDIVFYGEPLKRAVLQKAM